MKAKGTIRQVRDRYLDALISGEEITEIELDWDSSEGNDAIASTGKATSDSDLWEELLRHIGDNAYQLKKFKINFVSNGLDTTEEALVSFIKQFENPYTTGVLNRLYNLEEIDLSNVPLTIAQRICRFIDISQNHSLKKFKLPRSINLGQLQRENPKLYQRLQALAEAERTAAGGHVVNIRGKEGVTRQQHRPANRSSSHSQQNYFRMNGYKKPANANWIIFKNDLRAFGRFLGNLPAAIVGALFSIPMTILIHNPFACMIGALYGTNWKKNGIPLNLFLILISPIVFPIVAFLDNLKDGAKVGYSKGFKAAATFPSTQWKDKPYNNKEIYISWLALSFPLLPLVMVLALKLGLGTFAGIKAVGVSAYLISEIKMLAIYNSLMFTAYGAFQGWLAFLKSKQVRIRYLTREEIFPSYYDPSAEMLPQNRNGVAPSAQQIFSMLERDPSRKMGYSSTSYYIDPHHEMTPSAIGRMMGLAPDPTVQRELRVDSNPLPVESSIDDEAQRINPRFTFLGNRYSVSHYGSYSDSLDGNYTDSQPRDYSTIRFS